MSITNIFVLLVMTTLSNSDIFSIVAYTLITGTLIIIIILTMVKFCRKSESESDSDFEPVFENDPLISE